MGAQRGLGSVVLRVEVGPPRKPELGPPSAPGCESNHTGKECDPGFVVLYSEGFSTDWRSIQMQNVIRNHRVLIAIAVAVLAAVTVALLVLYAGGGGAGSVY
jgi:hypothetical protein